MKKWMALTLAVCLIFAFSACAKENEPEITDAPIVTGGWTVNTDFAAAQIPEDAQTAFDSAMESFTDTEYTPVALLGTQVVAGINYAFLCTSAPDAETPVTELSVVIIYRDLEGKAAILNTAKLNVTDYTGSDGEVTFESEQLGGGWNVYTETAATLPENVQSAFDKAFEGFTGTGYTPVAYLASQVVAGSNYAILCTATSITAAPSTSLAVVTVYADLEGGAEVTAINGLNISDFNQ